MKKLFPNRYKLAETVAEQGKLLNQVDHDVVKQGRQIKEIDARLKRMENSSVLKKLVAIQKGGEKIMGKMEELEASLDSMNTTVTAVAGDQQVLKDEIQALKDQVAAGTPVTEAQLDSALGKAKALQARLEGIDASVPGQSQPNVP